MNNCVNYMYIAYAYNGFQLQIKQLHFMDFN